MGTGQSYLQAVGSQLFTFSRRDVVRSSMTAIFAGVVMALAGVVSQGNFDIFTADWVGIMHIALNAAAAAFVGSLSKRYVSDQNGKVFGKIG